MTHPWFWWPPPARSAEYVLDARIPVAWHAAGHPPAYVYDVMNRFHLVVVGVPGSWFTDTATELLKAERAGRTDAGRIARFLAALPSFAILVDDETEYRAWGDTLGLARSLSVSLSDAAYLELALRARLPLATIDPVLSRAASSVGVPIFTP